MPTSNTPYLQHLTWSGIDARYYWNIGTMAREYQERIRPNQSAEWLDEYLAAFYQHIDPNDANMREGFELTFGIDLADLPTEIGKLIVYYAITADLPGRSSHILSRDFDDFHLGGQVVDGIALLQAAVDYRDWQAHVSGLALLRDVLENLKLS